MRSAICAFSHRAFRLARLLGVPRLYFATGRMLLKLYQALTYSRGRAGVLIDRIERRLGDHA
jgi:hypothetical protein